MQHQRRQPSETPEVHVASTGRHSVNLLPCPLAPSCLHVAVVPPQGVTAFPVDDRISKLKERVVSQMAEDISRRIHGTDTGSGSSDSASVLSDLTDVTIETTCSAPAAGNSYDNGDENSLPSEQLRQTSDHNSRNQHYSKFSRYFEKVDGDQDVNDWNQSSSASNKYGSRSERRRLGYSASFQHRRRRIDVNSPLAFDDAAPTATREFLQRQPSRSGSAPHLDEEETSHVGRTWAEKTVRGVHLREPLRRNANVFRSYTSTERVRPTSSILEEILLNAAEQSASSKSDTPFASFCCDDSSQSLTSRKFDVECNRRDSRLRTDSRSTAGSRPFADSDTVTSTETSSGDRVHESISSRYNSTPAAHTEYSNFSSELFDNNKKSSSTTSTSEERESQREPIITARTRRKLPTAPLSSCREGLSSQFTPRYSKDDRVPSSDTNQSNSSQTAAPTESHHQHFSSKSRLSPSAEESQRFQPRSAASDRLRPTDSFHGFHTSHSCSDFMTYGNHGSAGVRQDSVPPDTKSPGQSTLLGRSSRASTRLGRASTTSPLLRQRGEMNTNGDSGRGHSPVMGRHAFANSQTQMSTAVNGGHSPLPGNRFQRNGSSTQPSTFSSALGTGVRAGMHWNGGGGINPESWWNSMSKYLDGSSDDEDDTESSTNAEANDSDCADNKPRSTEEATAAESESGTVTDSLQMNNSSSEPSSVNVEAIVEPNLQTATKATSLDNSSSLVEQNKIQNKQNQTVILVAGLKPIIVKSSTTSQVSSKRDTTGSGTEHVTSDSTSTVEPQPSTECSMNTASDDSSQQISEAVLTPAENGQQVEVSEPVTSKTAPHEMTDFERIFHF